MLDKKGIIKFWQERAEDDWKTAEALFINKRYIGCLFFIHLSLEKLLKARAIKATNQAPPYIHDLVRLADLSKVKLNKEQIELLRIINTFNIRARYDDYKARFYKKATKSYTKKYFDSAYKFYLWLKKKS